MSAGAPIGHHVVIWLQIIILLCLLGGYPLVYNVAFNSGMREGKNIVYEHCEVQPRPNPMFIGPVYKPVR